VVEGVILVVKYLCISSRGKLMGNHLDCYSKLAATTKSRDARNTELVSRWYREQDNLKMGAAQREN
jgi:hypothetical protein